MSFDLARALAELQEQEQAAERLYSELLKETRDKKVVKELRTIRDGESKHVKLVQELIDYNEERKSPEVFSDVEPAEGIVLDHGATNLLVTKAADWFPGILSILKALEGKKVAYVALNKSADELKPKIKEAGVGVGGVKFVGTSKKNFMGKSEEACQNLTEICREIMDAKRPIVIFDHIAFLAYYNPLEPLVNFLKYMTVAAAKEKFTLIFVTTEKPTQKLLIDYLRELAKNTISVKKTSTV